jgi:hypothetical protein
MYVSLIKTSESLCFHLHMAPEGKRFKDVFSLLLYLRVGRNFLDLVPRGVGCVAKREISTPAGNRIWIQAVGCGFVD